ncbi:butyrophilin-like protein 2 isoform X2 [Myripristis murdjan]|nr:butyrophilin-like protein 2 isoform X2 [Myripristis murdjan]
MVALVDRGSLPSGRSVMAFCHTVCLLLAHSCHGQHQLIGPPQPIVAIVGDDVILPSHLEPATDAADMPVDWMRPDLDHSLVHQRYKGQEVVTRQNPSYVGRTSLFTDKLKHGNVSLKLSEVKLSDEGGYRCLLPSLPRESFIELIVGAASSPVINVTKSSSGVVLECESKGWYPEPELFWLDAEGKLLSAGAPETVRGPDGLYTVSSRVTVEKSHSNSFTCRVQQLSINQSRDTHIHVPGAASSPVLNMTKSSSGVVLECESKGWYPEPELFWLDAEGKLLSAGAPETVRGPDGLYTVSSRVTVEKSHGNSFTCRVQQSKIQQTRETQIHVPDDLFPPNHAIAITVRVVVPVMCISAVVFILWKKESLRNQDRDTA